MFEREHHRRIAKVLQAFDVDVLTQSECFFGGGTAIVLSLNEYRESADIDFLCSSPQGYRTVRNLIWDKGIQALFRAPVETLREVIMDRDSIRTLLKVEEKPIKLEIVREGRIQLEGKMDAFLQVPTLSRVDMYAEKLLANADRGSDKSTMSRDIIDLAMLVEQRGSIPAEAWQKVIGAYGKQAMQAFARSTALVGNPDYLRSCLDKMHMAPALIDRIPNILCSVQLPSPDGMPTMGSECTDRACAGLAPR